MLKTLEINNFRTWRETGKIRLAPFTVLFGTNSAGKTSLTQFLMMLKQTIESPDRGRVLHPGDQNSWVYLGTVRDFVFNHDLERELSFALSYDLPSRLTIKDPRSSWMGIADTVRFEACIESYGDREKRLRVKAMQYELSNEDKKTLSASMELDPKSATGRGKGQYRLDAQNYELIRNVGRGWPLPPPIRFYGFPDEAVAYYQNTGFLDDIALSLEAQFGHLFYVGPLRGYPERSYVWSGEEPNHVGFDGERAIEALLAARERWIGRGYRKRSEQFQKVVARWLLQLDLIKSFDVKPIREGGQEYEVLVQVRRGSCEVNLMDVGFGLSQLLPVIVECFYVPAGSTIIFEQPEIHLHPSVQAGLADLFIEAIRAREDGKDRGVQVIVESHSEHFLRRLQRRIAEEVLSPDEVATYFCEPGPSGSTIRELKVDEFGNIQNWPDSFFGDDMGDVLAMTDAAMERQMKAAE